LLTFGLAASGLATTSGFEAPQPIVRADEPNRQSTTLAISSPFVRQWTRFGPCQCCCAQRRAAQRHQTITPRLRTRHHPRYACRHAEWGHGSTLPWNEENRPADATTSQGIRAFLMNRRDNCCTRVARGGIRAGISDASQVIRRSRGQLAYREGNWRIGHGPTTICTTTWPLGYRQGSCGIVSHLQRFRWLLTATHVATHVTPTA
jgi:hypothetical protein